MRAAFIASCAAMMLASIPSPVAAQRQAFVDGLVEFTTAIQGAFGDEGAQIRSCLDRMEAALATGPIAGDDARRNGPNLSPANSLDTYRRLLHDRPRTRSKPFADTSLLPDSVTDAPVLPPAAYAQGYARLARGQYADALAAFRAAAAQDPLVSDPAVQSTVLTKAIAAAKQERLGEARSLVEGGATPQESSEAHRVRGLIYWAASQDDKSVKELETAIRMNPRDERSRLVLFRVLSSAGRAADAERTLKETIRAIPDSALAHWWLGRTYEQSKLIEDARREFAIAAPSAIAGRAQVFTKIGQLAVSTADVVGGSDAFAQAVEANRNDPEARKRLAGTLMLQGLTDRAFVELVAALLIDPQDPGAHAGIGQILLNTARHDAAIPALQRAVELSADYTEARYALATALMRAGRTQEAAREFERVELLQRKTLADERRKISREVLEAEGAQRALERDKSAPP